VTFAYLGLGSNLGDRLSNLQCAVDGLGNTAGVSVVEVSAVYETSPVGGPRQPRYLNAAVAIRTRLPARALLEVAHRLEDAAGRVREERWGPRTLDVDVLIVGDETVDTPDLVVPHPRMQERGFVLAPMEDLATRIGGAAPKGVADGPSSVSWPGVSRTDFTLRLPRDRGKPAGGRRR